MESKFQNTKEVLTLLAGLYMGYENANSDGKISWTDFACFIAPLKSAFAALDDIKECVTEIKGLSKEDKAELCKWFNDEFDIKNDDIEKKVEEGLDAALALSKFLLNL
jgi:hypothetical protein